MMKKHLLTLTFATLCVTTSAMATFNEEKPEPKRFAVLTQYDLQENITLNMYAVTKESGPFSIDREEPIDFEAENAVNREETEKKVNNIQGHLESHASDINVFLDFPNVNKFAFEIKNPIEKAGYVSFIIDWYVRQQGIRDFHKLNSYPWLFVTADHQIENLYMNTWYQAVAVVDTNHKPYRIEGDNVYYGARVHSILPIVSSNNFVFVHDLQQIRNSIKWSSDFTTPEEFEHYLQETAASEYQDHLAYDAWMTERTNQLEAWKHEALEKVTASK